MTGLGKTANSSRRPTTGSPRTTKAPSGTSGRTPRSTKTERWLAQRVRGRQGWKVQSLNDSVTVPYGSFDHVLVTKEWTPLEPSYHEHKYYAPGVDQVYGGGSELVN